MFAFVATNQSSNPDSTKFYGWKGWCIMNERETEYGKAAVYDISGRLISIQNISPASVNAFNVTYHEAYIVKVDMPTDNVVKKLSISK